MEQHVGNAPTSSAWKADIITFIRMLHLARMTRLELATFCVTGRRSTLLSYIPILVPHKHLVFNELFLCVAPAMLMHMLYLTTIVVINWYAAWGTIPQPMD